MQATKEKIIEIIKETVGDNIDINSIESNVPLSDQQVDSLDRTSIFLGIEESFDIMIPDEVYNKLKTIDEIVDYLNNR